MKKFTEKLNESVDGNKLPTAEEFFDSSNLRISNDTEYKYIQEVIKEKAIEFAKLHVEAALKAASGDAHTKDVPYTDDVEVDKDSILNAYPLEKIK
jgi:hypothetical protein